MKENLKVFQTEINSINDESIKQFTVKALESLPEYFWEVPASSTGKYHPQYALGEGGLVRHTKGAVKIALELFNNHTVQDFTSMQKDIIISSLLLHDGCKSGMEKSRYTQTEHPLIVADYIYNNSDINGLIKSEILDQIVKAIRSHMGEWNKDYRTKREVLPTPKTRMERFVHMCDYLASRKSINMEF
ncbi:HD domain-containing protein [Clostridium botulinum]|uniref:HD domain-containing protein n=1 Tax=Clostridium botulinum TaxID=1491 RepID=UPI0004D585AC|nr:HD domain-containing protein [Clostridium botulinum]KEH99755.1 hypothetical protein Z952_p0080 [Clostridium botulinum C/D str. BKT75002]KEI05233.1 hypothetical protein Z954_0080 [Clostridium botulinum C/D str. BKT2873]MCD3329336.1 hypothetical protein [Clostridium botulinum D/C]MCD3335815.1 hypothetical protein [Clostridium botulinum D/C]MCD3344555.1 hypothetical protein [Clostridium botulinum D/C]